jgi:MFS family permease
MSKDLSQYQDPNPLRKNTIRWYIISLIVSIIGGIIMVITLIGSILAAVGAAGIDIASEDATGELSNEAITAIFASAGIGLVIVLLVALVMAAFGITHFVYYCMWSYRVNKNASTLKGSSILYGPVTHVLFILGPIIASIVILPITFTLAFMPILSGLSSFASTIIAIIFSILVYLALKSIAQVNDQEKGLTAVNVWFYITVAISVIGVISGLLNFATVLGGESGGLVIVLSVLQFILSLALLACSIANIIYYIKMVNQVTDGQVETYERLKGK